MEEEDLALSVAWEEALRQLKVNIIGKIQLEVLVQTVLRRFQIPVFFDQPKVVYKETVAEPIMGCGHFEPIRHDAEAALRIEPGARGEGISFDSRCHVNRLGIDYKNLVRLMSSKPFIREY